MNKPGQGFKRGNLISFMAIPFPVPQLFESLLKDAAKLARSTRLQLEASPANKALRESYAEAITELERIENMIRAKVGIQETRQEFLTLSEK